MKRTCIIFSTLFAYGLIAWLISCAINPVTGKRELMLLSENDEQALGAQTDQEIMLTYGLYDTPELTAYVDQIGQRMAKLTHRPQLTYRFKVLDSPVINAFAVPGGYVYFTRGILGYLNNEAELAGVLGHELGHINARHSAQQYSRATLASLGLGVGMMLSEDFRKYAGLAQFGVGMLFLRFSRDNERQSDDLGVEYSSKSGYDAMHMANFFNTLERMHPSADMKGLPAWFSTHPNPEDRIGAVQRKTKEWQQKLAATNFAVNTNQYLNQIDDIIFGEDPRQGYIDGNTFYHPSLKFTFPVPNEWQLNNTPQQVQMVAPKEDAAILFSLGTGNSPQAAERKFVQESRAIVRASDAATVNRMPAKRLIADVPSEQDTLRVLSYFIQKDNKIYVFHGLTYPPQYGGYLQTFTATMAEFDNLSDLKRINVQPATLSVRPAQTSADLATVLRGFGIPQDNLEDIALLNGMQLTDRVAATTLLKVVRN